MELHFEDGSKLSLPSATSTELGRSGSGDRTVSRRHILLQPHDAGVDFEVVGRNPIWVVDGRDGGGRIFRKFEKGELGGGDRFSLSVRSPCFVEVRGGDELGEEERRKMRTLGMEAAEIAEFGSEDVSNIEPVKEFGFLVIGHEFDHYPKLKIRDSRHWDWFLEGSRQREDSEDEEGTLRERSSSREKIKKRKGKEKFRGSEDEDWTGESESENEKIAGLKSSKRLKAAVTRSKDKAPLDESRIQKPNVVGRDVEEDEDDETLGGFIVENANAEEEEEETDSLTSEEEFVDDYDEED